jgi:hypothetical protein
MAWMASDEVLLHPRRRESFKPTLEDAVARWRERNPLPAAPKPGDGEQ